MKVQSLTSCILPAGKFTPNVKALSAPVSPYILGKSKFTSSWISCDAIARSKKEDDFFQQFLKQKGKVTLEQYRDIVKNHPKTLVECYKICESHNEVKTSPDKIAKIAIDLKRYYDDLYGKDYTIVSVGTSPSAVTEVMQNIGCKVIFAPISNLRLYQENRMHPLRALFPTIASRHTNVSILMKYLTKKGVAKKRAGNLVVLDFIHSGKSLDLVVRMLEERGDIPTGRIFEHSIIHDLADITKKYPHPHIDKEIGINFHNDLIYSRFHELSNVPHFAFDGGDCYKCKDTTVVSTGKRVTEVFREFDEFSLPDARAWSLCSLNEAMKLMGLNNS